MTLKKIETLYLLNPINVPKYLKNLCYALVNPNPNKRSYWIIGGCIQLIDSLENDVLQKLYFIVSDRQTDASRHKGYLKYHCNTLTAR